MSRAPDVEGPRASAWLVDLARVEPKGDALLRAFLVHAPGAHPWWDWYLITLVHLRSGPGLPEPVKAYPEAEYEIAVQALSPGDPSNRRSYDPDTDWSFERLTPPNVVEQFHGLSEPGSRILLDRLINAITRGILSPDSDHRKLWKVAIAKA